MNFGCFITTCAGAAGWRLLRLLWLWRKLDSNMETANPLSSTARKALVCRELSTKTYVMYRRSQCKSVLLVGQLRL